MIQVQVNPAVISAVNKMVSDKIDMAEEIIRPRSLTEIAKAVFVITGNRFLRDLSAAAIQDPDRFHHLYEWNQVGNNNQRLFIMRREGVRSGNLVISLIPKPSTSFVPIDTELLQPGETGKVVSSQSIFRDKMRIMEENTPIFYETKRTIVFSSNPGMLVFVPKNTVIEIMSPGGGRTQYALRNFANQWYSMSAQSAIIDSRMFEQIGREVAKVMNKSSSTNAQVFAAVNRVTSRYSKEVTSL